MDLPAAYQRGCNLQTAERALPLKKAHLQILRDATLSKNFNLNGNLAVLRCCLIAFKTATPATFHGQRSSSYQA